MIVRVLRQALASGVGPAAVAAAEPQIVDAVEAAGGRAVLTDSALPSGSDRIMAALATLDPQHRHDSVINLQGDMPLVDPAVVAACVGVLERTESCDIATVVAPESGFTDRSNPDVVKAVLAMEAGGAQGRALYFTRSRLYGEGAIWRHVGVYGYRRGALARFTSTPASPLERREGLEQLRALELGLRIDAAVVDTAPLSVDTPADLEAARRAAAR